MRISVTKKIMGMVLLPILLICVVVGVACGVMLNDNIASEIEKQLHIAAYNFKEEYELTSGKGMDKLVQDFKDENNVDVTIFEGNERIISTVEGAVGTTMDDSIFNSIKGGDTYFATNANVNGEAYYGYYIPIMKNNEYVGASFTGIPQAEVNATIKSSIIKIVSWVIGCGIIATVIAFVLVRKMVKSIKGLEDTIGTLLDNDLATEHEKYEFEHDEIEELNNSAIDFAEHLRNIVNKIKKASNELKEIAVDLNDNAQFTNDTCSQISFAVESVATGAVSQAEDTSEAANSITEMSSELGRIKRNTNDLHSIAYSMDNAKANAIKTLSELQKVNGVMTSDITFTSKQVNATSESVEEIKRAVNIIQDIAQQTKLLSFNASIEAAHAGEHGKGFAVVADEIGKLASESAKASGEIEKILNELVCNYDVIIQNVRSTSDNVIIQNAKLMNTQNVFDGLEKDINGAVERIVEINTMVESLDAEIRKMVDMVSNLSAISEENSASTEEVMAAIEELTATINHVAESADNINKSASTLIKEVNVFKTGD